MRDFLITPELELAFHQRIEANKLPYHNSWHIHQMFSDLPVMLTNSGCPLVDNDILILNLAILGHDVVYSPGQGDNEERSATATTTILRDYGCLHEGLISNVANAIRSTKPGGVDDSSPLVHQFLHDLDYLVFGLPGLRYYDAQYMSRIYQEYLPPPSASNDVNATLRFLEGRRDFLKSIDPFNLFLLECNSKMYSAYARINIDYELSIIIPHYINYATNYQRYW